MKHKIRVLQDAHKVKTLSNKTPALTKCTNMGICFFGTSNKLFIKGSPTETKFSKKQSSY